MSDDPRERFVWHQGEVVFFQPSSKQKETVERLKKQQEKNGTVQQTS